MSLTEKQIETITRKYHECDKAQEMSLDAYLDSAIELIGGDGAVVVPWCGMMLVVETDGYSHT